MSAGSVEAHLTPKGLHVTSVADAASEDVSLARRGALVQDVRARRDLVEPRPGRQIGPAPVELASELGHFGPHPGRTQPMGQFEFGPSSTESGRIEKSTNLGLTFLIRARIDRMRVGVGQLRGNTGRNCVGVTPWILYRRPIWGVAAAPSREPGSPRVWFRIGRSERFGRELVPWTCARPSKSGSSRKSAPMSPMFAQIRHERPFWSGISRCPTYFDPGGRSLAESGVQCRRVRTTASLLKCDGWDSAEARQAILSGSGRPCFAVHSPPIRPGTPREFGPRPATAMQQQGSPDMR